MRHTSYHPCLHSSSQVYTAQVHIPVLPLFRTTPQPYSHFFLRRFLCGNTRPSYIEPLPTQVLQPFQTISHCLSNFWAHLPPVNSSRQGCSLRGHDPCRPLSYTNMSRYGSSVSLPGHNSYSLHIQIVLPYHHFLQLPDTVLRPLRCSSLLRCHPYNTAPFHAAPPRVSLFYPRRHPLYFFPLLRTNTQPVPDSFRRRFQSYNILPIELVP